MLRPPGQEVHFDTDTLLTAPFTERQAMLESIVDGMLSGDIVSGNTAYWLGHEVPSKDDISQGEPVSYSTETAHGNMVPKGSLTFLRGANRLTGFIGAIKRWSDPEAVIDVGCGPFPVLALAAAIYHPKAEITAIEINPKSADKAAGVVDAFGLSDRLHVINADIADHVIDTNTSAAVTETFNAGLAFEPGPRIVRLLSAAGIPTITPSSAKLCLTVGNQNFFNWVDLRNDTHGKVEFANLENREFATISAAFYDDLGLVLDYGTDIISRPLSVGGRLARTGGLPGARSARLTYELGDSDFSPQFEVVECAEHTVQTSLR